MSNLPLKALKWHPRGNEFLASTASRLYRVTPDKDSDGEKRFCVYYGSKWGHPARGFATVEDAKHWAEHKHYQSEMQPYIVPDFISIDEQLPEKNTRVLVLYHAHFENEEITEFDICTAFFHDEDFDVKDQNFYTRRKIKVVGWKAIDAAAAFKAMKKRVSKQGE